MSISIIRSYFETKLKTWADAQVPAIRIAMQNVAFEKPQNGQPFLECFLIPTTTFNRDVSAGTKTLLGMFQVNVWAQKNKGMRQSETIAESIVSLFPVVPKIGNVSVDVTPLVDNAVLDNSGWIITPILIKYRYEGVVGS